MYKRRCLMGQNAQIPDDEVDDPHEIPAQQPKEQQAIQQQQKQVENGGVNPVPGKGTSHGKTFAEAHLHGYIEEGDDYDR